MFYAQSRDGATNDLVSRNSIKKGHKILYVRNSVLGFCLTRNLGNVFAISTTSIYIGANQ